MPLLCFRRSEWDDQLAFGGWCGSGPEDSFPTLLRFKGSAPSKIYSRWSEVVIWSHGGQHFRYSDKSPLSPTAHCVPPTPSSHLIGRRVLLGARTRLGFFKDAFIQ